MKKTVLRILFAVIVFGIICASFSAGETFRFTVSITAGLVSLTLLIISRVQLGKAFAVTPQAKGLVTKGIYSKIQHPLYLFIDIVLASLIALLNIPLLLIFWAVLVAAQLVASGKEEKVLEAAFGEQYRVYSNGTWI